MPVAAAIKDILQAIPSGVTLIAVSKTKPITDILQAYEIGQLDFGENKVQEMVQKFESLPKDIRWHYIGHLQTNKVKFIVPFVHLIHGVDTLKLLLEINKRAENEHVIVNCLLQLSIADEETKYGFSDEELLALFEGNELQKLKSIRLCGLMGMATFSENEEKIKKEFAHLNQVFQLIRNRWNHPEFKLLSMGMTNDYKIAIEEGSNMIRIGSRIFGERPSI